MILFPGRHLIGVLECHQLTPPNNMVELKNPRAACEKSGWIHGAVRVSRCRICGIFFPVKPTSTHTYGKKAVGRRGTNQLCLLEQYLDILVKHTTEIPPPIVLVEGISLRWLFILGCKYVGTNHVNPCMHVVANLVSKQDPKIARV
jgi:hypothetical protein